MTMQAEPHDILHHQPPTWKGSYNERLFGGHFRGWFHRQRFEWAIKNAQLRSACDSIFEIGCYDGRLLRSLTPQPSLYVGVDADTDNQISQTRGRLASSSFVFLKGNSPRDIAIAPHLRFDTAFALEVIYYFSDELLDEYAKFVAERCDGPFVVTTLNESGPFLAARYLLRRLGIVERDGTVSTYTLREVAKASLGQTRRYLDACAKASIVGGLRRSSTGTSTSKFSQACPSGFRRFSMSIAVSSRCRAAEQGSRLVT